MTLTNLGSIIARASSIPTMNTISFSGAGPNKAPSEYPAEEQFPRMAVGGQYNGKTVAPWEDDKNTYARQYTGSTYMAIGAIAKMVAMQDIRVMRRMKKKSGVKYESVSFTHPLQELLEEMNPIDAMWDIWFYMVGWRLLTGDSYLFKAKNGFGVPVQLWPVPSQWIRVVPDPKEFVAGYEISSGVDSHFIPRDCMMHIKNPSLDWQGQGRFYGTPSIKAAATTIELEKEMLRRLYYTFKNFAPPGMVFQTDQRLQPHQVHQLWANLAAQHSMSEHSGRPMVVHSGLTLATSYQQNSQRELDYTGSLDMTLDITLATHGVPRAVLGLTDGSNKASMDSALTQFCKMTIDPILKHFSQHFTQNLARDFEPDKSLVVKIGPCVVNKEEQLAKIIEVMLKAAAITPDEVREVLMDMDPMDSPHGSKAVMVSGFQAIDPDTGRPDLPQGDATAKEPSETVAVGRQALGGRN